MAEHLPAHGKWGINPLVCFAFVCSSLQESFLVPAVGLQAFKIVTGLIGMCWVQSIGVSAGELLIGSSCACWGLGSLSDCSELCSLVAAFGLPCWLWCRSSHCAVPGSTWITGREMWHHHCVCAVQAGAPGELQHRDWDLG